ncbi:Aste57867_17452 [Aphanomyces stellatus]|uniref:Aste57867_17452 protein n=1 Tax=Aphanomyces stellatus TaxID=120398 RepID=A0A485L7Y0_9STRA|nr:hypothetical protein As57867_017392 [Aphanomyces stellatus]VFT94206.1 Aste57867_17452 [Aphanomyces stellatus]
METTSTTEYQVTGTLCLVLYVLVALGILPRIVLLVRLGTDRARLCFHVALLLIMLLNMPRAVQFIWFPTSEAWIFTFLASLVGTLLLDFALGYVCIEWAKVAVSGRAAAAHAAVHAPLSVRNLVVVGNVGVLGWAIVTAIYISVYPDTDQGAEAFDASALSTSLIVVGGLAMLATTLLLVVQGARIRARLLESQRFVPEADLQRSLTKLVVSIATITLTTWIRLGFNVLAAAGVDSFAEMPLLPFVVWSNLAPNVFPVICLLYLQRRIHVGPTKKDPLPPPTTTTRDARAKPHRRTHDATHATHDDDDDDASFHRTTPVAFDGRAQV